MAIKNFIVKNKKKSICFLTALIICIVSVFSVIIVKQINAGVFRKDENGNSVPVNEIKILEIVAREGEQVLGYTVEGQEPISVSDIESYKGNMDLDVTDFKNVTGYDVTKKANNDGTFSYKVNGSKLNRTFNNNVLGESMSKGEIQVKAIQAADVKVSDVEWADLIYINSNDYNSNLMYYYDQFVCNGSMGIEPGQLGQNYNDVYLVNQDKLYSSIDKIIRSVGNKKVADTLTNEDFEYVQIKLADQKEIKANLSNYKEYNLSYYREEFGSLNEEISDNIEDGITRINNLLSDINSKAEETSLGKLKDLPGKTLTDEEKEENKVYFLPAGFSNYLEFNADRYFNEISKYSLGITASNIKAIINDVNAAVSVESLEKLLQYKNKAVQSLNNPSADPEADKYGFTQDDYDTISECFKKVNLGNINEGILFNYTEAFLNESFKFTTADAEAIRGLIDSVNKAKQDEVLDELANAAADEEKMNNFCDNAETNFEYADINGYDKYYINNYIDALKQLTDANAFKTDAKCDLTKIEKFIEDVNKNTEVFDDVEVSCDLVWKVATSIYNKAMSEDVALMYNTELLTNKTLGDYTQDLTEVAKANEGVMNLANREKVDNTNNVYKLLLLSRQIRDSYYADNLSAKIDVSGVYYPAGLDGETEGVNSWNMNTFDGDDGNAGDTPINYAKYREPEVVGQTYGADGTNGSSTNYVYKRIYSFTGDQFFGGAKFTSDAVSDDKSYIITANSGYSDSTTDLIVTSDLEDDNYILISAENNASYQTNNCIYAHFWDDNNISYKEEFVKVSGEAKDSNGKYTLYKVCVPKGYRHVLLTNIASWNGNIKTADYTLPSDYKGKLFYISGTTIKQDTSGRNNYVLAGITNSKLNDTVAFNGSMDMKLWAYNNEVASNNFTASYRLYVDNTVIFSSNDAGYHYLEGASNAGNQPFTMSDTIKIKDAQTVIVGDDEIKLYANDGQNFRGQLLSLSSSNKLRIELNYNDASGVTHTSNYYYQMAKPSYDFKVTNFIKNGQIEYVNFANLQFTYTNMDYVRYSVDNGAFAEITADNSLISIGSDKNIGDTTQLIVKYKPVGGDEIVITTTLKKSELASVEHNYLSENTATNSSGLTNDPLLTTTENSAIVGKTKGDVLVYLLRVSLMNVNYPINVLEVQPQAHATDLDNADMAKKILQALKVDIPSDINKNYKKYVNVTSMSVKEFNTRNDELTATYDLIYFGINPGYQYVSTSGKTSGRTKYNDSSMDGLIYTGIGDKYTIHSAFGGMAASDYEYIDNNSIYRISSAVNKTFGLDANANGKTSGTNIICYNTTQTFKISNSGTYNGEEIVKIERNNLYIGVSDESADDPNKVNVELRTKDDNNTFCQWIMHRNSDGTVTFENYGYRLSKNKAYCIDLNNAKAQNKENIQIYQSKNNKAQKWILEPKGNNVNSGMSDELYNTWKKYYTTGMTGNSNSSWNLDMLDSTSGRYYMKNEMKTTRIGGNDITVRKMNELLEYLKSGYPILLADEIMNCDNSDIYDDNNGYEKNKNTYTNNVSRWPYVDHNSKMYNFILQAKALGKDENGNYTGLDSDGNKVFMDNKSYASLVSISKMSDGSNPEYLSSDNKFEGGLRFAFKRVEILNFEFKSGPKQYDEGVSSGNTGKYIEANEQEHSLYNINLGFKDGTKINENQIDGKYIYKVYIDKSGFGKFEDVDTVELSPEYELIKDNDGYVTGVHIYGNWPENIEGFIPWKVEAVDANNAGLKYTYIGNSAFRRKEAKDVYVLWIKAQEDKCTLDFCNTVKNYSGDFSNDYRIHLITMYLADFNEYYSKDVNCDEFRNNKDLLYTSETSKLKVKSVWNYAKTKSAYENNNYNMGSNGNSKEDELDTKKLNELSDNTELDMIVCGFCDSYSQLDINDIAALKNIEYFVNSGHSLLYSHDNSSFNSTIHRYSKNGFISQGGTDWARYETYFLKTLVGQDRYGITASESDLPEEYVNARKYLDTSKIEQADLRGMTETWTFISNGWGGDKKGNKLYVKNIGSGEYVNMNTYANTEKILQMNKGQITAYPFVLPDSSKFSVATTHTQYSELNLEDSEVTVWYALDSKQNTKDIYYYTKGDGCNNYYIYSKGNVTYTGAGHSKISGTDEQKLFVNTLVASIKTGNYAPVVKVNNAISITTTEKIINYYKNNGATVTFTVSDYDLKDNEEKGFSDFRIYIDVNGNDKYDEGDILINDPDNADISDNTYMRDINDENVKINITKDNLKNKKAYSFYLSDGDIKELETRLGAKIENYNIIVEAIDNGYLKAKDDVYREATKIKASDKFKLKERKEAKLFDLN